MPQPKNTRANIHQNNAFSQPIRIAGQLKNAKTDRNLKTKTFYQN
jgi:hypothetical protein